MPLTIFAASPVAAKNCRLFVVTNARRGTPHRIWGALAALPLAHFLRIPLPQSAAKKRLLFLSGFCAFVGFPVLFTIGVGMTSANHTWMLLACLLVFTVAIAMA